MKNALLLALCFLVAVPLYASQTLTLTSTSCNSSPIPWSLHGYWKNLSTGCTGYGTYASIDGEVCGSLPTGNEDILQKLVFCKPSLCCYFDGHMATLNAIASDQCTDFVPSFVAIHFRQ